jgi:hypothetical protein
MHADWAAENLQVIRTLMERSALYRRALAPTMLLAGGVGVLAAAAGLGFGIEAPRAFVLYWMAVAVAVIGGAFFVMRRQAVRAGEPFWSPPARRVVQAAAPAFAVAAAVGWGDWVILAVADAPRFAAAAAHLVLPAAWMTLYGLGLHAAGFFMPRGIRWLGWLFVAAGCGVGAATLAGAPVPTNGHWLMGGGFGVTQLLYGLYLANTEPRSPKP